MELLEGLLSRPAESVVFVEDGHEIPASRLRDTAGTVASRLKAAQAGRIAIHSNRPSVLAACLLASSQTRQELVVLRSPYPLDSPFWRAAGISAFLDEQELQVHRIPGIDSATPAGAAILIPTSGTSGEPKIAHHLLASLMGRIRPAHSRSGSARWLLTYQPSGFAGLQILLTALATDSMLVCLSAIDVPRLAEAAGTHRVTHISGTPTFWRSFLLCLGESAAFLDLEQITMGGEVVDQATLDRLRAVFPHAGLSHIYASTEAGALFSVRDGRAGFPARWLEEPVDGVSLRIRDGVLEVRSPRAMLGYVNSRKAALSSDGWLITGDRAEQRGDRIYFLGRDDSWINVGGGKVTPEEVETALMDTPGVLDLRAFAAPNPITGFVVGLEVVAGPEASAEKLRQDILKAARERLAGYKVPRLVRFVDAVRSDASGKKSRKAE